MGWYNGTVFLILAGASGLFVDAAVAENGGASLGTVKIDAFQAEVQLGEAVDDHEHLVVTIRGVKPKGASHVRTDRIKVWLLRSHFKSGGPALALAAYPEKLDLPEREVPMGIEVQATFKFSNRGLRREHMFAVVVAIDDEPNVFKLPQARK